LIERATAQLRAVTAPALVLRECGAGEALGFPDRFDVAQRFVGRKTLQAANCATLEVKKLSAKMLVCAPPLSDYRGGGTR
jgi:hypothetical protein